MQIGKIKDARKKWKLGEKEIEACTFYKYLGDLISNDGKKQNQYGSKKKTNCNQQSAPSTRVHQQRS